MRKIIAIVLCAALLATAFTGCASTESETPDTGSAPVGSTPPAGSANQGDSLSVDLGEAFSVFAPNTIMIIAGDYNVTWAELYVHMRGTVNNILANVGEVYDWSEIFYNGMSYEDMVMASATDNALMFRAVEYAASMMGVQFSESDIYKLQEDFASMAASVGSEEEFHKVLWEQDGISSFELFEYLVSVSYLASILFEELYGYEGELLTDEDANAFTAYDGYLMAKHILRVKTDDGSQTPLIEAEGVLGQLESYDGDEFDMFFDALMYEYSEDGGLESYPYGYLFQNGDMVDEFYEACVSLDIGEHSGIVESDFGYHILLRLPINFDVVPFASSYAGDYRSLRSIAASAIFDNGLYDIMEILAPEFTADYYSIDIGSIF